MTSNRRIAIMLLPAMLFAFACKSGGSNEDDLLDQLANLDKETIFERAEALYRNHAGCSKSPQNHTSVTSRTQIACSITGGPAA